MAVYKVPQDVEAVDKFLGPLSFIQFLFAGGMLVFGWISWSILTSSAALLSIIFIIPTLICAILAFPWSREQPTEIWLGSRIRFFFRPRRRIWDQTGMKELVTITAPKKVVHNLTDGLSQDQVQSRMSALASMVDSRGWAAKNYDTSTVVNRPDSDRLVAATMPEPNPMQAISDAAPDIMDAQKSGIAKKFTKMINSTSQNVKFTAQKNMNPQQKTTQQSQDYWFMHQQQTPQDPNLSSFQAGPVVAPGSQAAIKSRKATDEERTIALNTQPQRLPHNPHEKTVDPHPEKQQQSTSQTDIMNMSQNNDLNVATIQRQANKPSDGGGTVEIPLR